ncbi:MAG: hypothetical protein EON92_10725 [Burkholderiales bacterium]|nr:MAG: hypothetical protein EON92_10725 [Burkholderiales bacterium]
MDRPTRPGYTPPPIWTPTPLGDAVSSPQTGGQPNALAAQDLTPDSIPAEPGAAGMRDDSGVHVNNNTQANPNLTIERQQTTQTLQYQKQRKSEIESLLLTQRKNWPEIQQRITQIGDAMDSQLEYFNLNEGNYTAGSPVDTFDAIFVSALSRMREQEIAQLEKLLAESTERRQDLAEINRLAPEEPQQALPDARLERAHEIEHLLYENDLQEFLEMKRFRRVDVDIARETNRSLQSAHSEPGSEAEVSVVDLGRHEEARRNLLERREALRAERANLQQELAEINQLIASPDSAFNARFQKRSK